MQYPPTYSIFFHREAPLDLDSNKKLVLGFLWLPSDYYVTGIYSWRGSYTIIEPGTSVFLDKTKYFRQDVTPKNPTDIIDTVLTSDIELAVGQTLCVEFYLDDSSTAGDGESLVGADVIQWYVDYTSSKVLLPVDE